MAIGRAIVKEPKAFLFDEPLSNLDAALRARTRVELAELHQRLKSTMIYVTHDQVEAMTLADRIVVLNDCRIEQVGTPMEVYTRPASRFVAGFVGSPAMNFLKVTLSGSGDRMQARLADGGAGAGCPASAAPADASELGVRPEALTVAAEGGETEGTATVVERLGERTLVHVRLRDGTQVTAQDRGISTRRAGPDGAAAVRHLGAASLRRGRAGLARRVRPTPNRTRSGRSMTVGREHRCVRQALTGASPRYPLIPAESVIASVTRRWKRR